MALLDGPRFGPAEQGAPGELVVLCHGIGADGQDLIDLGAAWAHALPHALFVAPDAPFPYDEAPMGRQWFSRRDLSPAARADGVAIAAAALSAFLDAELARVALPAERYALMGFSQGAMTALYTGLRRPVPPRAILAFSGALIAPEKLAAEMTGRPPVLLVHGEADEVVPADRTRDAEAQLRTCGVPVESLLVPGLGHAIDDEGLSRGALFLQRAFSGGEPEPAGQRANS